MPDEAPAALLPGAAPGLMQAEFKRKGSRRERKGVTLTDKTERIKRLRKKAMGLPLTPGVYIMKNSSSEIIYIGKAKALKNRVSSYFGSQTNMAEKVRRMVSHVEDFDYILTDSEFEALVLECSLIKQNKPKYNILLKDDKGYSYIRVSKASWPRITAEKQIKDDGATYIGPYTSNFYVKNAVDEACKIFKLPTCSRRFPEDIGKGRPCLNYHIKQCFAPCRGKTSEREYNEIIDEAVSFLKNSDSLSVKDMEKRMMQASENLDFELAAKIRDRINALKKIREKQKVVSVKVPHQDVIAFSGSGDKGCFSILRFKDGRLFDKEDFLVSDAGEVSAAASEFIKRYYSIRDDIPPRIYTQHEPDDLEAIEQWLTQRLGKKVSILTPQKGEQAHLVAMCKSNADEKLAQTRGMIGKVGSALEELRELLGLEKIPEYIESYDISNLSGDSNVAGMVVFKNGKPLKNAYRRFKIKSFVGQDDYASMNEVLTRRFTEYENARKKGDTAGFGTLPDLILLDGGKGQISAVRPVLEAFGLDIPLFGMVKDNRHKTRAITDEGREIEITYKRQAFTLVSTIQEEVHRYAISYHRQTRKNTAFKSSLTDIDGIGSARAKALLKYFKTVKRISQAYIEELESAPGMNKPAAAAVYNYFHSDNE